MIENENSLYWNELVSEAKDIGYTANGGLTNSSAVLSKNKDYETYVFANFDICNFTKYKREHPDWVTLLRKFLNTIAFPPSDWTLSQFWKFNGDSATFRKKVGSVEEICKFIQQAQDYLNKLQELFNENNKSSKMIYIKAAVWIAGFPYGTSEISSEKMETVSNNTKFFKSPFGEEFVGENIDEGFRLAACSKAGKLVLDPKLVLIIHFFYLLHFDNNKFEKFRSQANGKTLVFFNLLVEKLNESFEPDRFQEFKREIKNLNDDLFLMEYVKCKGVWDDRDYPVFWYIPNIKTSDFLYDEIVDHKKLREHKVYRFKHLSKEEEEEEKLLLSKFSYERDELVTICSQIEVISSVNSLVKNLSQIPTGTSEENIHERANLYYTVACVVIKDNHDLGILIFKRSKERKHLKYVWDLIPVKHARTRSNYGTSEYLKNMVSKMLYLSSSVSSIHIIEDELRNSVQPYAMCTIYRNGEIHNGILCVAEMHINCEVDEFIYQLKEVLSSGNQYDDVRLVSLENIENDSIIFETNLKIKSLSPDEVRKDSHEVAINEGFASFGPTETDNLVEKGISYLSQSIKQILEGRSETSHA